MSKIFSERQKQFILAGIKERTIFKDFLFQQRATGQDFTIEKVSKVEGRDFWDIIFLSAGTKYLAEIKVRNTTLTQYKGSLIEKYKFDRLINECQKYSDEFCEILVPLYVTIHLDNKIALFNLYNITEPVWSDAQGKVNTVVTTSNPVITKHQYSIPFSEASIYNLPLTKDYNMLARETAEFLWPNQQFVLNRLAE